MAGSSRPSDSAAPVVVTARTMKDAYKIVRQEYGEDAIILGTRTVNRRQELGLGHERQVEVTVQLPGAAPAGPAVRRERAPGASLAARPAAAPAVQQGIIREVARIEELVEAIAADHARLSKLQRPFSDNVLAETLIGNGATPEAVETLLTRFTSETGAGAEDRPAALAWLTENLRASNCSWDDFYGCHAFIGDSGSGRSDLVLTAAGLLQKLGRRTLVLSLMPGNNGSVRHLQLEAARGGFDAAVIKKAAQLTDLEDHLAGYDVVLVDMPHLRHPEMAEGGAVHAWLARNGGFHRHLLVPLDRDPRDLAALRRAARAWNCDWIAISRADLTDRPAKILDVLENVPVPVSLVGRDPVRTGQLEIAQSDRLLDAMLGDPTDAGFRPGVTAAAEAALEVAW